MHVGAQILDWHNSGWYGSGRVGRGIHGVRAIVSAALSPNRRTLCCTGYNPGKLRAVPIWLQEPLRDAAGAVHGQDGGGGPPDADYGAASSEMHLVHTIVFHKRLVYGTPSRAKSIWLHKFGRTEFCFALKLTDWLKKPSTSTL